MNPCVFTGAEIHIIDLNMVFTGDLFQVGDCIVANMTLNSGRHRASDILRATHDLFLGPYGLLWKERGIAVAKISDVVALGKNKKRWFSNLKANGVDVEEIYGPQAVSS